MNWGQLLGMGFSTIAGSMANEKDREQQQADNRANFYMQLHGQKEMADYNKANALDIWNKTNYPAQVEKLKEAGLNPALLYGQGGGGGATTSGGSGGGVGLQSATRGDTAGAISGMGLMAAQLQSVEANTELARAQANKTNAEAENISKTNQSITPEVIDAMSEAVIAGAKSEREKARSLQLANNFEQWLQQPDEAQGGQSVKERQARSEVNLTISKMQEIDTLIGQSGVYQDLLKAYAENTDADTGLKQQLKQQLDKVNPVQLQQWITDLETAKKQLEIMSNDPANSQVGQYIKFTTQAVGDVIGAASSIGGIVKGIKGVKEAVSTHSTNPQGGVTETHTTRRRW